MPFSFGSSQDWKSVCQGKLLEEGLQAANRFLKEAYADGGYPLGALELYDGMQNDNVTPDSATFVCILKACGMVKALSCGKLVHEHILSCGLGYDLTVRNSLISMYVKCGRLDKAIELFEDFRNKNLVSWNALMTGYVQNELGFPALELFEKMLAEGVEPDKVSFLCALKASACSGAILQGRLIHDLLNRGGGFGLDIELALNLIDMYAKCGSLEEACKIFELVREYDMPSWAIFLSKGGGGSALQHLDHMQKQGLNPSSTLYTSILSACSQEGRVEEGCKHFSLMSNGSSSMPSLEHYNCIIDSLGRTGCVYETERLLRTMPFSPDVFGWMSLLTACKTYGYSQNNATTNCAV